MSLLVENFDIHLGKVEDHCTTLTTHIIEQLRGDDLCKIFNQPRMEMQKHRKNPVQLDDYVIRYRIRDRIVDALKGMEVDELDGEHIVQKFCSKLGFQIDAILLYNAPKYRCNPNHAERTHISFVFLRFNNRRVLKEVARVEVVDHFSSECLWDAVRMMWKRYPKNNGQVKDKDFRMMPIYQIKHRSVIA